MMKKLGILFLILSLLLCACGKPAEPTDPVPGTWGSGEVPPSRPDGENGQMPEIPTGAPDGENGAPPEKPDGMPDGSAPMEPSGEPKADPPGSFRPPEADASIPPEPTEDMTILES